MSWDAELAFAHHLADVADAITLPVFRAGAIARIKADGTPVTEADEGAERAIRAEIGAAYPDHGIVGEESGVAEGTSGRRWIVDPIDGTKSYAAGIPIWATLVALEADGEIVCGVISAPALGERYAAATGSGATLNGEAIGVSDVSSIEDARLTYTSFRSFDVAGLGDRFRELAASGTWARGFGDFWGHMLVASGRADVMVEAVVAVWDLAPIVVIVEQAGGRFTDLSGARTISGGSALSTNGRLHDATLAAMRV